VPPWGLVQEGIAHSNMEGNYVILGLLVDVKKVSVNAGG
jgi:hypothetical protein